MKLFQISVLILLFLLPLTNAQEDTIPVSKINIDKSVNWLMQQPQLTAMEAALTALAATKSDLVNKQDIINKILNLKHKQYYCWPSNDCNVKDTALALFGLSKAGSTASFDWLRTKEIPNTAGEWFLQIETQSSGTCSLSYQDKTKNIEIDKGKMKSDLCPFSTQFNLNNCLEKNLLAGKTSLPITVQCGSLGSGRISLVYKAEDKFFLVGEASNTPTSVINIKNSNFGDYDSTLYTAWALKFSSQDVNSIVYLKRFYNPASALSASLMYLITEDESYINDLLNLQDKISGSFGSVYDTALAVLALRKNGKYAAEADLSKSWLESQMQDDYSWNKDIKDTAIVIYGAYGSLDIVIPGKISAPIEGQAGECNSNGVCELYLGETNSNCPSDCYTGDGVCESESEDETSAPDDCQPEEVLPEEEYEVEEGHGFFFWFFIFLFILAVLVGAAYLYYKKIYLPQKAYVQKRPPMFRMPAPKQPVYQRPSYPQPAYKHKKTFLEEQLEKSLEEAKKLFKK